MCLLIYADCYRKLYGTEYKGTRSSTLSGIKCQRWSEITPHHHTLDDPDRYPDGSVAEASNYCRNPHQEDTGRRRPWCFTVDKDVEWEYCDVPMCDDACKSGNFLSFNQSLNLPGDHTHLQGKWEVS